VRAFPDAGEHETAGAGSARSCAVAAKLTDTPCPATATAWTADAGTARMGGVVSGSGAPAAVVAATP
jgi:hypothetical protein